MRVRGREKTETHRQNVERNRAERQRGVRI